MKAIEKLIDEHRLTGDSSACEICRGINGITASQYKGLFGGLKRSYKPREPNCYSPDSNSCLDSDKAQIRLNFLQVADKYL